jgi:hypothetical protein
MTFKQYLTEATGTVFIFIIDAEGHFTTDDIKDIEIYSSEAKLVDRMRELMYPDLEGLFSKEALKKIDAYKKLDQIEKLIKDNKDGLGIWEDSFCYVSKKIDA